MTAAYGGDSELESVRPVGKGGDEILDDVGGLDSAKRSDKPVNDN